MAIAAGVPTYDINEMRLLTFAMANAFQNSITVMAVVTDFHRASDLISLENRGALFDFLPLYHNLKHGSIRLQ